VAEELSDAFDRSLSDQQNEVEQFKLAYMAISLIGKTFLADFLLPQSI
jgi:hypothetical protein